MEDDKKSEVRDGFHFFVWAFQLFPLPLQRQKVQL